MAFPNLGAGPFFFTSRRREPPFSREEGEADRAHSSFVDKEGTGQSSLIFSLEGEDEEGKALSPSLGQDGKGEGLRPRL